MHWYDWVLCYFSHSCNILGLLAFIFFLTSFWRLLIIEFVFGFMWNNSQLHQDKIAGKKGVEAYVPYTSNAKFWPMGWPMGDLVTTAPLPPALSQAFVYKQRKGLLGRPWFTNIGRVYNCEQSFTVSGSSHLVRTGNVLFFNIKTWL